MTGFTLFFNFFDSAILLVNFLLATPQGSLPPYLR